MPRTSRAIERRSLRSRLSSVKTGRPFSGVSGTISRPSAGGTGNGGCGKAIIAMLSNSSSAMLFSGDGSSAISGPIPGMSASDGDSIASSAAGGSGTIISGSCRCAGNGGSSSSKSSSCGTRMEYGRGAAMPCDGSTGGAVTSSTAGGMTAGEGDASLRTAAGGGAGGGVVAIASWVTSGMPSVSAPLSLVLSVAGMARIGAAAAGSSLGIMIACGALASAGVMDSLVTTSTDL